MSYTGERLYRALKAEPYYARTAYSVVMALGPEVDRMLAECRRRSLSDGWRNGHSTCPCTTGATEPACTNPYETVEDVTE